MPGIRPRRPGMYDATAGLLAIYALAALVEQETDGRSYVALLNMKKKDHQQSELPRYNLGPHHMVAIGATDDPHHPLEYAPYVLMVAAHANQNSDTVPTFWVPRQAMPLELPQPIPAPAQARVLALAS